MLERRSDETRPVQTCANSVCPAPESSVQSLGFDSKVGIECMRVRVHRHADVLMAEPPLDCRWAGALLCEERGSRVPQMVDSDGTNSCGLAGRQKVSVTKLCGTKGKAPWRRKDESSGAFGHHLENAPRNGQCPALLSLRGHPMKCASDFGEARGDVHPVTVDV